MRPEGEGGTPKAADAPGRAFAAFESVGPDQTWSAFSRAEQQVFTMRRVTR